MRTLIVATFVLLMPLSSLAGGDSAGGVFGVAGMFRENFDCTPGGPGSVDMTLTQNGINVIREDSDGRMWTGTVIGMVLTVTTTDVVNETSTLTFTDDDNFGVASAGGSGGSAFVCTGTGTRI